MYCKDRISALHDDLLLKILSEIPTKDAVTTMILSKRWGLVWTLMTTLEYKDTRKEREKKFCCFVDKFLQLHKAPVLESLRIQIDHYQLSNYANERKCVSYALDHCVRELALRLPSNRKQKLLLPSNVYTSKTLMKLTLAGNSLVVDVPSLPCLPSLQTLVLTRVMYENSNVELLSNFPALRHLEVFRDMSDNATWFVVKVPSLNSFTYKQHIRACGASLVLDSPGLRHLSLNDAFRNHCSIESMPHLDSGVVIGSGAHQNDKFLMRFFSSVRILHLSLDDDACYSVINFPRLVKLTLRPCGLNFSKCSLELVMLFLHSSPILKQLTIIYNVFERSNNLPFSWNQQSSVPECLLSHLEIFVWDMFGGRRHETDFVAYILANSKCLKMARISPICSYHLEEKENVVEELKSMYRVSASSQLKTY